MQTIGMIICVGVAGAIGTLTRYGVTQLMGVWWGNHYPWGTTAVNILGCFLFGFMAVFFNIERIPTEWKPVILTGFLGGFTTFAAFAFEIHQFWGQNQYGLALLHLGGQNILGIAAIFIGFTLGRHCI